MPLLDVTELLSDPDLATPNLWLLSHQEVVGSNGRAVQVAAPPFPMIGVVGPARARDLLRLPEGSVTNGAITVITVARMSPGNAAAGQPADKVQWRNDIYLVGAIDDYTEYGIGFVSAVCTLQNLNPA